MKARRSFGVALREARGQRTQEEIAREAGLTLRTIQRLEKAENAPQIDTMRALVRVLPDLKPYLSAA